MRSVGTARLVSGGSLVSSGPCHCRACQKQSGSAFSLIGVFPADQVAIEGDCSSVLTDGSSGHPVTRYFCDRCGSPIYSETQSGRDEGLLFIKAGILPLMSILPSKMLAPGLKETVKYKRRYSLMASSSLAPPPAWT